MSETVRKEVGEPMPTGDEGGRTPKGGAMNEATTAEVRTCFYCGQKHCSQAILPDPALAAKLEKVKELVEKWRKAKWESPIGPLHGAGISDGCRFCADELATALADGERDAVKESS